MIKIIKRIFSKSEPPKPIEQTIPVTRPEEQEFSLPPAEYSSDATLVAPSYASQVKQQVNLPVAEPVNPVRKTSDDARDYIEKVRQKEDALAMRFASGTINRKQFEELYASYQQEIRMVEQFMSQNPESQDWRNQVTDGQSMIIRRRHQSEMTGYSIYDLRSGLPIQTRGDFGVDPALFVPMLFAYQSATREIFGGEVRLTQIEGGKWLCFIPGKVTSTIALFNNEPTQQQLKNLEQSQKLFEEANAHQLQREMIDPDALVLPHDYYLKEKF
jgi:hypothetical protein